MHLYQQQMGIQFQKEEKPLGNGWRACIGEYQHVCFFHVVSATSGWVRTHLSFLSTTKYPEESSEPPLMQSWIAFEQYNYYDVIT
jgi:hypothetical protein